MHGDDRGQSCCEKTGAVWQRSVILAAPVTKWSEHGGAFLYTIESIGDRKIGNLVFHFLASWSWYSNLWVCKGEIFRDSVSARHHGAPIFKLSLPLRPEKLSALVYDVLRTITQPPYRFVLARARSLTVLRYSIKWLQLPCAVVDLRSRTKVVLRARPKRAPKRPRVGPEPLPLPDIDDNEVEEIEVDGDEDTWFQLEI